jgi:hypothetical protein
MHKKDYLVNLLKGSTQSQPGNLAIAIENGLNVMVTAITVAQSDEESDSKHEDTRPWHTHEHSFNEEE